MSFEKFEFKCLNECQFRDRRYVKNETAYFYAKEKDIKEVIPKHFVLISKVDDKVKNATKKSVDEMSKKELLVYALNELDFKIGNSLGKPVVLEMVKHKIQELKDEKTTE